MSETPSCGTPAHEHTRHEPAEHAGPSGGTAPSGAPGEVRGPEDPDHRALVADLHSWAAEHGLVLTVCSVGEWSSQVVAVPDPVVIHALTAAAVAGGDVPSDWDDDAAPMAEGSPSWTWCEASARAYDRHRVRDRRDAHLREVTALHAAHGFHGAVELRVTGTSAERVLEHLASVRTGASCAHPPEAEHPPGTRARHGHGHVRILGP